jgi:hypothetical protein
VALLPLIAIGVLAGTGRRVRWLLLAATLVLAVCLGVPYAVMAWIAVPFMDRILHLLYFYSQYWQILLALLAGVGLDTVLRPATASTRRIALWVLGLCIAIAAAIMAWHAVESHAFYPGDVNLQANLHAALILGLAAALLMRAFLAPREIGFAVGSLLLITLVDLSLYFDAASRADRAFTAKRGWAGATPSAEQRAALRTPWGPPQPQRGFIAGTEMSMPIQNEFWPGNYFMTPKAVPRVADGSVATALWNHARSSPPLLFYDGAIASPAPWSAFGAADVPAMDRRLLVSAPTGTPGTSGSSALATDGFTFRWKQWLYNEFRFEVAAPANGWLMVRQLHDPAWRVEVDGREVRPVSANAVAMAIPLEKGSHEVHFEFRPLSRRLYWPAAFLLEAVLAVFLTLAWMARGPRPARRSPSRARPPGGAS